MSGRLTTRRKERAVGGEGYEVWTGRLSFLALAVHLIPSPPHHHRTLRLGPWSLFSLHTRSSYSHLLPVGTRRETTSVTREVTRRVTDMEAGWEGSFIAFATRALHAPPTSHKKSEETEWEGDMNGQPTDLRRINERQTKWWGNEAYLLENYINITLWFYFLYNSLFTYLLFGFSYYFSTFWTFINLTLSIFIWISC